MNFCDKCGYTVEAGARYCITCGAAVAATGATVRLGELPVQHLYAGTVRVVDAEDAIPGADAVRQYAPTLAEMLDGGPGGLAYAPELHPVFRSGGDVAHLVMGGGAAVRGGARTGANHGAVVQHPGAGGTSGAVRGAGGGALQQFNDAAGAALVRAFTDNGIERARDKVQASWLVQSELGTIVVGLFLLVLFLTFLPMLLV